MNNLLNLILFISIGACTTVETKETYYYCNRNVQEVRYHKDNLFVYSSYFENGQLKSHYTLKDSLYHDEFKLYSDMGDLVMYCKFDSGKPISDLIGVKANGDTIYTTNKNDSSIFNIFDRKKLRQ